MVNRPPSPMATITRLCVTSRIHIPGSAIGEAVERRGFRHDLAFIRTGISKAMVQSWFESNQRLNLSWQKSRPPCSRLLETG